MQPQDPSEQTQLQAELLKDPGALCKCLFRLEGEPVDLAPFQEEVISAMIWKTYPRLMLWSTSQIGKSEAISMGLILVAMLYPNERIVNVSATNRQAGIIFQYVQNHLFDHPLITSSLTTYSNEPRDKVLSKLNREEISFTQNTTLKILSAESGIPAGQGLLGHQATTLVLDESTLLNNELYRTKILRMLGAKRKKNVRKIQIEIGTATHHNHFTEAWYSGDFHNIQVDWKRAVKEGRLDINIVNRAKKLLTSQEFDTWYNCILPDKQTNRRIPDSWIKAAVEKEELKEGIRILGIDPAGMGTDIAVLTPIFRHGNMISMIGNEVEKIETSTSGELAERIRAKDIRDNYKSINIDANGIGEGTMDRLTEASKENERIREKVFSIKSQRSASKPAPTLRDQIPTSRFFNLKAEIYTNLVKLLEDGNISISNDPNLIRQLRSMELKFSAGGLMMGSCHGNSSPNELDSLAYACYQPVTVRPEFFILTA